MTVPTNSAIFQEKLNLLYSPNKTAKQKLEDAYMAAVADPGWQPATPVDRAVEDASWTPAISSAHTQRFTKGRTKRCSRSM
ncbi:hypothetical protein [Rhodanobacter lindaniclasticus]